jgi:hypothetical protein
VSRKYKGKARASIDSFMYVDHFDFWLLAREPNIGGFKGFDLTNPRGRFGGERFHLLCPKLGLGDAILSHTILVRSTSVQEGSTPATSIGREGGCTIGGFPTRGPHYPLRGVRSRLLPGLLEILSPGFSL